MDLATCELPSRGGYVESRIQISCLRSALKLGMGQGWILRWHIVCQAWGEEGSHVQESGLTRQTLHEEATYFSVSFMIMNLHGIT